MVDARDSREEAQLPPREAPGAESAARSQAVARMRSLAWLLDASIPLPFTSYRIGLDAVIGLVPGLGDAVSASASGFIILQAWRLGAAPLALIRMLGNVLLELVVGAVPVLGDLFDMVFKANLRNVELALSQYEGKRLGSERGRRAGFIWVAGIAVVLATTILASLAFSAWALIWLLS